MNLEKVFLFDLDASLADYEGAVLAGLERPHLRSPGQAGPRPDRRVARCGRDPRSRPVRGRAGKPHPRILTCFLFDAGPAAA